MFMLIILLLIVSFVAAIFAVTLMIDAGKAKGYSMDHTGLLWFIGLFAPLGFIAVGLYVNALPYRTAPVTRNGPSSDLPPM